MSLESARRLARSTPAADARDERLLKVAEAAYSLSVSRQTIYDWIAAGVIRRVVRIGRRPLVRIPESEVRAVFTRERRNSSTL